MEWGHTCANLVLPLIFVKRNVTVPEGTFIIDFLLAMDRQEAPEWGHAREYNQVLPGNERLLLVTAEGASPPRFSKYEKLTVVIASI